jgi:mannose/cellobiose epimerase-like protein (N-acyl-D-glucosamine 2-epimerase family)
MSQIPFAELSAWMFQDALPFWAANGVDREHGGFLEELSLDGRPTEVQFKRVRTMCRQTYAFSHAALLGWEQGAELSRLGYEYLVSHAKLDRGWARLLSREGRPTDTRQDLYDLAFVLYAMVWRYKLSRDPEALAHAHGVLDFIDTNMRHGEGFWHMLPPEGPRLQNPHMHLLEASIAGFEATQDERFLSMARELTELFRNRLFDGRTLGERFNEDWSRRDDEAGRTLEPGHQFEWAWILAQYQKLSGADFSREAETLVAFSELHGVDPQSQAVFNSISDAGVPRDSSSRSWTNTERIKGWLGLFELTGRDPTPAVASSCRVLLERYLAPPAPRGAWTDHFDASGRAIAKAIPASILYHVFLAFAEVLRLEPKLSK